MSSSRPRRHRTLSCRPLAADDFFGDGQDVLRLDEVHAFRAETRRDEAMDAGPGAEIENDAVRTNDLLAAPRDTADFVWRRGPSTGGLTPRHSSCVVFERLPGQPDVIAVGYEIVEDDDAIVLDPGMRLESTLLSASAEAQMTVEPATSQQPPQRQRTMEAAVRSRRMSRRHGDHAGDLQHARRRRLRIG